MATTYKTPGVYVEEISLFPPSVAQVETAVPAFIGYTEKASLNGKGLLLEPTKIRSLAEFEEAFGAGPPIAVDSIELDNDNNVTTAALTSGFLLYDCLRLFYANGGAKCYIISIGSFPASAAAAAAADFEKGLEKLEKEDEPTLILFPDAVLLTDDKLYSLQQQALAQCAKLGDRFAICDLYATSTTNTLDDRVEQFRDKIGIRDLKYGAAYAPYLRTNLTKNVTYRHVKGNVTRNEASVTLLGLASDSDTTAAIGVLENAMDDVDAYETALAGTVTEIESEYLQEENDFKAAVTIANYQILLAVILKYLNDIGETIGDNTAGDFADDGNNRYLRDDVLESIDSGGLFAAASELNRLVTHAGRVGTAGEVTTLQTAIDLSSFTAAWGALSDTGDINDYYSIDTAALPVGMTIAEARQANMLEGAGIAANAFKGLLAELSALQASATSYEETYEAALVAVFPLLATIIKRAENSITELPPSAAVAGVYADVDDKRGVWKAPANVSLSSVVGVTDLISHDEQKDLNIDVVAGKSVNAIRPFTGKGILVWGARTLAGNDNEWRYIPVRRFFNMVEESTKKATEAFVFEPNDANTWIKVKSMIENFLINQWRAGALAGPTPEAAFFVKVGLGQTMTAQDVLNGYMIVEIGMAAVRPAEFIILRFSHKMQEA